MDTLPIELLEHIFSFLQLEDRKSISLVCRLWNELAFSHRYMRQVTLNIPTMDPEYSQLSVLKSSTRLYRNAIAFFGIETCSDFDFGTIIEVLDLFGVTMERFHCMTCLTVNQLWNVVALAPNLRQLIVAVDAVSLKLDHPDFPVLQHMQNLDSLVNVLRIEKLATPNLTHLTANFFKLEDAQGSLPFLRQVAPRLKNLELYSTEYFFAIDELRFPQLETLKLSGQICNAKDDVLKHFFIGFNRLTEVHLEFCITGPVLDVITRACAEIVNLHFKTDLLEADSFRLLERLKRLKTLSLAGDMNFRTTSDCKPLVSVKDLHLKMTNWNIEAVTIESLSRILPNVVCMTVVFTTLSRSDFIMTHVCRNFPHMNRLTVFDKDEGYRMLSCELFQALGDLDQLEELTLKCIDAPAAFMVSIKNLRRLKFKYSHNLTDEDLCMLSEMYPNLKVLKVVSCPRITQSGIAKFQSQLPNCVVYHSKQKTQQELDYCLPYFLPSDWSIL